MRIVIFSDTHNSFAAADQIFKQNKDVSDNFLFLGDGTEEVEHLRPFYPEKNIYCVSGNCDHGTAPQHMTLELGGIRIFMTHGHHYNVRDSVDMVYKRGREERATLILFGHTHCRYHKYMSGVHLLNPGSASQPKDFLPPSYAVVDILPTGLYWLHIEL